MPGPGKPFKPGQSGNPTGKNAGRPKQDPDVIAMARAATPDIMRRWIAMATGKIEVEPAIAMRAGEAVVNRAYGTPRQSVDVSGDAVVPFVMWLPKPTADADEWASRQNGHASN